jgi:hypothetical protein
MLGGGGVAGSQPMRTAVHMEPNKLWRSNSILTYGRTQDDQYLLCSHIKMRDGALSDEVTGHVTGRWRCLHNFRTSADNQLSPPAPLVCRLGGAGQQPHGGVLCTIDIIKL